MYIVYVYTHKMNVFTHKMTEGGHTFSDLNFNDHFESYFALSSHVASCAQ